MDYNTLEYDTLYRYGGLYTRWQWLSFDFQAARSIFPGPLWNLFANSCDNNTTKSNTTTNSRSQFRSNETKQFAIRDLCVTLCIRKCERVAWPVECGHHTKKKQAQWNRQTIKNKCKREFRLHLQRVKKNIYSANDTRKLNAEENIVRIVLKHSVEFKKTTHLRFEFWFIFFCIRCNTKVIVTITKSVLLWLILFAF